MHRQFKRAFTLIELLVVVGIMAILAAILFPVFARARENARRTSCLSNMKQIGLGIMLYTQDYDERLPMSARSTARQVRLWDRLLNYTKNKQVFVCPSTLLVRSTSWVRGKNVTTGANVDWDTSYGYNYFAAYQSNIYFEGSGANIVYHDLGVVMSEIKNPAQTVAIADTDAPTIEIIERPRVFYRVAGGKGYLTERHLGGINVLWMDGHVKWTKISALVQPPDCTPVPATVIANACDNDGSLWDRN